MFYPILKSTLLVAALAVVSIPAQATEFLGNHVPQPAFDKAVELSEQGHDVRKVVFIPGGGWVVIFDNNGFYAQGTPQTAIDKLNEVAATDYQLKTITFTPQRGWVILFGPTGYWYQDIPTALAAKLAEVQASGAEMTEAVVTSTGGWAILGKGGLSWVNGLHQSLTAKIIELAGESSNFTGLAVSPLDESDWVVLFEGGYWYQSLDEMFVNKMQELFNDGFALKSFTYANQGQGLLIW